MKKVSARRRRIPAFGEWNYDGGGCGGYGYGYGGGDWPVTQYFDAAMQAGLVVTSLPPSPMPVKKVVKWSDSAALPLELELEKQQQQQQREHKLVVGLGEGKKQGKQSRVADAGAHAGCRVVKAVDQDLYEIPPDMLCHKPRKRLARRLWTGGCLGLGCVA